MNGRCGDALLNAKSTRQCKDDREAQPRDGSEPIQRQRSKEDDWEGRSAAPKAWVILFDHPCVEKSAREITGGRNHRSEHVLPVLIDMLFAFSVDHDSEQHDVHEGDDLHQKCHAHTEAMQPGLRQ
eukprot:495914-Prymnesium_polylepis.1